MYLQIRQKREDKSWSQDYVAEKIGTSKQAIQQIETGKIKPSFGILIKLLYLFGYKGTANRIVKLFTVADETPDSQ